MITPQRRRGRPKGSGRPDGPRLDQIADLMVASPGLKPTTAIKRTNPAPGESDIRRLQEKWRTESTVRLQAAHDRQAAARAAQAQRSQTRRSGGAGYSSGAIAEMERRMAATQRLMDVITGAEKLTALDRAARGIEDSSLMRVARAMEASSVMKAAKALDDSPTMRAARALEESSAMRLWRQMEDSPAIRLSRELDRLRRYGL